MTNTLSKTLSILLAVMLGICLLLFVLMLIGTGNIDSDATFVLQMDQLGSILQYNMIWTYILFFVAALFAILFPLVNIFTDMKQLKNAAIFLVIGIVVFILAYLFADSSVVKFPNWTEFYAKLYPGTDSTEMMDKASSLSQKTGTGIIIMYILFAVAAVSILYAEVSKAFK